MSEISKKTTITLGAVGGVALVVITFVWQTATLKADIVAQLKDNWTLPMQSEFAARQAIANPGQKVPDPRNPGQFFEVESK